MTRILNWIRNNRFKSIILLIFCVIAKLDFLGKKIGYKTLFWDIPVGALILMLIAVLIAILTIKGYGRETYRIAGVLALYLLFHLLWGHFSPISFKAATYFASFWIFEFVFLTSFALLGKAAICGWIINLATLAVLVVSVYCMISIFFTADGSRKIADFLNNNIERNVYRAFFVKIQETNKESVVEKPLFEKMEYLYQKAEKGFDPNDAVVKKIGSQIKVAYPEEVKKEKEGKERTLSGVFEVPVGKDVFHTGLFSLPNDFIFFEIIGKNHVFLRDGLDKKIKIYSTLSLKANDEGEIQFWRGSNPAKIKVNIKPK